MSSERPAISPAVGGEVSMGYSSRSAGLSSSIRDSQGSGRRARVGRSARTQRSGSYQPGRDQAATWEGELERRAGEVTAVAQPARLPAFEETEFFKWLMGKFESERLRDG